MITLSLYFPFFKKNIEFHFSINEQNIVEKVVIDSIDPTWALAYKLLFLNFCIDDELEISLGPLNKGLPLFASLYEEDFFFTSLLFLHGQLKTKAYSFKKNNDEETLICPCFEVRVKHINSFLKESEKREDESFFDLFQEKTSLGIFCETCFIQKKFLKKMFDFKINTKKQNVDFLEASCVVESLLEKKYHKHKELVYFDEEILVLKNAFLDEAQEQEFKKEIEELFQLETLSIEIFPLDQGLLF